MESKEGWTSNKLLGLIGIVEVLMAQDDAEQFARPISVEDFLGCDKQLRLEEYLRIVARPMDFSTVQEGLKRGAYPCAAECIADLKLIFTNCRKYNSPRDSVARTGRRLEALMKMLISKALPREEEVVVALDMPGPLLAPSHAPQSEPLHTGHLVDFAQEDEDFNCRAMPLTAKYKRKIKLLEVELKLQRENLKVCTTELWKEREANGQLKEDLDRSNQRAQALLDQYGLVVKDNCKLKREQNKKRDNLIRISQRLQQELGSRSSVRGSQPSTPRTNDRHIRDSTGTFLVPFNVRPTTPRMQEESETETAALWSPESSRSMVFGRNRSIMEKHRIAHRAAARMNSRDKRRKLS